MYFVKPLPRQVGIKVDSLLTKISHTNLSLDLLQVMDGGDNLKNCPKFASFNYINSIIGSGVIGKLHS